MTLLFFIREGRRTTPIVVVSICLLLLISAALLYSALFGNILPNASAARSGNVYGEELTGLPFSPSVVDVDSAGRIYVGTALQGLWRSADRGLTWIQVNTTSGAVFSVYVDSRDYVYAQIAAKVYRSIDGGGAWTLSRDTSLQGQWWMWDEDSQGYIYANNYDVLTNDYIYRSTDQGATFSIWYNVTASPNPVRHIHSVDVAPNDYVFVTTGDSDTGQIDDNTIRRWNRTAWEILAQSTAAKDQEPRAISIWFMNGYAYTAWDLASYLYRFPITGTWEQRERIISTMPSGTNAMYDAIVIDEMVFGSTNNGYIFASWDNAHWVKLFQMSSGEIAKMSSRKKFPLYFVDRTNHRLFRLNAMTKEDLVQLFYRTYNSVRGFVANTENYTLEQRVYNGKDYLDFTSVALTNAQASLKGLSKTNRFTNAGFEFGDKTGWTVDCGGAQLSVVSEDKEEGMYSLKAVKCQCQAASIVRQQTTLRKGDTVIVSWYWKSNASVSGALSLYVQNASAGYGNILTYSYSSPTSWTKYEIVRIFNNNNPFDVAFAFRFEPTNVTTYFDASLMRVPETGYQNQNGDNLIAYNPEFFNSAYFSAPHLTVNPTLTIGGQIVSYSGTLANGTASIPQSLTGVLTSAVKIDANIQGSGQAILRVTGTRVLYEDSVILQGRKDNVYYGRYYGVCSPTPYTKDLVAVTCLTSNITSLSYKVHNLSFCVNSPLGTASTILVFAGDAGPPIAVSGAASWTYDATGNLLILNVSHTFADTVVSVKWRTILGDVNGDGMVDIADYAVLSAHWYPGPPIGPLDYDPIADLNHDGAVNMLDVGIVNAYWGRTG